jgi:hypothetical protein
MIEMGELKEYAKKEESEMVGEFLLKVESKWCILCTSYQ